MDFSNQLFAYDNLFLDGQFKIPVAEIFQVSELSLVRGGEIVAHEQYCDEITYVISGNGHVLSGGMWEELRAGQIHYIKKDILHQIIAEKKENMRFICIGFLLNRQAAVYELLEKAIGKKDHFIISDDKNVKALSELLIREFYAWDEHSGEAVNRYFSQILVTIYRVVSGKSGSPQGQLYEKNSSNLVFYKTLRYIDREYIYLKAVKEIVEALSYSECYLSHLFKKKMGISMKEYLVRKKITYGIELLKTSQLSVEEIADYLNFTSAHSFRRAFKQYTGQSPSQFKQYLL